MAFEVISALTEEQIQDLHTMYQSEWWTKGRQLSDIRLMLRHSDLIIAFCDIETKRLVAFARVLTDYVYKASLLDVIVAASHRGQGLGGAVMDRIMNHPALKSVRHLELYCLEEMMPFYQKWGFTEKLGELRFMRKTA
jgi:predicted GNAT family N-acyltransferase